MDVYPAIERHGIIGDLQTAALVADDGTIDWYCSPRFDSPSMFASLLDRERGGFFRITVEGSTTRQLYLPGTAILITRFMTGEGVGEVIDFMPVRGGRPSDRHLLVRLVRVVRGRMRFVVECRPAFDYGREEHKVEITENGVGFGGTFLSVVRREPGHADVVADGKGGVRAVVEASAGQSGGVVLQTGSSDPWSLDAVMRLFDETRDFWRGWIGRSSYRGRWREMVERAAMTLKLMTYAPTGALVAAPTAGLPEQVGGERNWDYRFTWIRDASFSVHALLGLGFEEEAEAFLRWLGDRVHEGPLRIMYRIDGSSDLEEETLGHLEGYRGSAPVRVGNGAAGQSQLDIYGEALDSICLADERGLRLGYEGWASVRSLVDWLCGHWDRRDAGLWETRGGPQDFVYGRLMSWVALDRAVRIARRRGLPGDLATWTRERDAIYQQVMERGWSEKRGAFVQHYGGEVLDASLLYMPLVGFVAPNDPRWLSTLRAMDRELVSDSLVYRYDPGASPDGLRGSEGTFSMCTFWYVEALARSGRLDDARLTFEKMLTYANHLGLYSEEIGPTGEQLGNFPQAFSHLALITAAVNLDRRLDGGRGEGDIPRRRHRSGDPGGGVPLA
ncbi:glycoside hydrolase family 15 protein [Spirillospora sp. NPDC047279]|uniref:glycoside hydrolase family 15 protein n=1 Tax=Spirillospora sp. NPDC047279 TaxID=3155478 RepID=UPI00340835C6